MRLGKYSRSRPSSNPSANPCDHPSVNPSDHPSVNQSVEIVFCISIRLWVTIRLIETLEKDR